MNNIDKYKSISFGKRRKGTSIKYIIIHYTAMIDCAEALRFLCDKKNKVSSHFLISKNGKIYHLVDMKKRAWHAGKSFWKNIEDINSYSIGIELDNSGYLNNFENYSSKQINSLIKLIKNIVQKYNIDITNILGHSDISPYRKIDPGEKFPWKILKKHKLSYFPGKISEKTQRKIEKNLKKHQLINKKQKTLYMLRKIGYDVKPSFRSEKKYKILIKAYQMHFRPKKITGNIDIETYNLIQSHFNQILT
tara:strand:- start:56 stop:802 length:747 start_codon:yes stop_codon:yes gene_type:complete